MRTRRFCWAAPLCALLVAGCEAVPNDEDVSTGISARPPLTDADGDGISDVEEGAPSGDTDGDGTPDCEDADSDGDGLPDALEAGDAEVATAPFDSDGDGRPDFRDEDSDDNGIPDAKEGQGDTDGDGKLDFASLDDDGDGVADVTEIAAADADCNGDGAADPPGDALAPSDCDGDGQADYHDADADGDGISDAEERGIDADGDGFLNLYDLDSDNDGLLDAAEAGDADPATRAADTDGDGTPDFLDPDSDDDGLSDLDETIGGSSPIAADTDGDGTGDLVEVAAGTDPTDAADDPRQRGDFVFVVPYQQATKPPKDTLEFRTSVQFADVYFAFDRTASMGAELVSMKNPVTGVPAIVSALRCTSFGTACLVDSDCGSNQICFQAECVADPVTANGGAGCVPDLWTGVGIWEELNSYQNLVSLQPDPAVTAAAVPGTTGVGANECPFQPPACIADPSNCTNTSTLGCDSGGVGCPAFRSDAIRIYVQVTDADNQGCGFFTAALAGGELASQSIRFIGLYGTDDDLGASTPLAVAEAIGVASGTVDAQNQPFVYLAEDAAVVTKTVQAVREIVKNVPLEVTVGAVDAPGDAGDALQFLDYLEVNTSGVGSCSVVSPVADGDGDGRADAFPALTPGTPVCWDVHPVPVNTTVAPTTSPQLFRAKLTVYGDGSPLDQRTVYFLVPPKKPEIPPPN